MNELKRLLKKLSKQGKLTEKEYERLKIIQQEHILQFDMNKFFLKMKDSWDAFNEGDEEGGKEKLRELIFGTTIKL